MDFFSFFFWYLEQMYDLDGSGSLFWYSNPVARNRYRLSVLESYFYIAVYVMCLNDVTECQRWTKWRARKKPKKLETTSNTNSKWHSIDNIIDRKLNSNNHLDKLHIEIELFNKLLHIGMIDGTEYYALQHTLTNFVNILHTLHMSNYANGCDVCKSSAIY